MINLDKIGFYTLTNERAKTASEKTPLSRCEIVLTNKCNFNCPYCRHIGGEDLEIKTAVKIINFALENKTKAIRFSGGEPTLYKDLGKLISLVSGKIERIAISTNGSSNLSFYKNLIKMGVNDFSISLDACCAEDNKKMTGNKNIWEIVISNIKELSKENYVTVGTVLTNDNIRKINEIVKFASDLGVADVRIIPAAQYDNTLNSLSISKEILDKHPILKYRVNNIINGRKLRGLSKCDSHKCGLVLDDLAIMGDYHYPCIIYMRENGKPVGKVDKETRKQRKIWYDNHDTFEDEICKKNCLDVCIDYNNLYEEENRKTKCLKL